MQEVALPAHSGSAVRICTHRTAEGTVGTVRTPPAGCQSLRCPGLRLSVSPSFWVPFQVSAGFSAECFSVSRQTCLLPASRGRATRSFTQRPAEPRPLPQCGAADQQSRRPPCHAECPDTTVVTASGAPLKEPSAHAVQASRRFFPVLACVTLVWWPALSLACPAWFPRTLDLVVMEAEFCFSVFMFSWFSDI